MLNSELVTFLRAWAANPLQVAAIAPSGDALSDLITSEIAADVGPVLELGPGTGVFTRALLARGVREENLTLVEYGEGFASTLELRFPEARVLWMDAARLSQQLIHDGAEFGAVVSGLPILSMPPRKVMAIMEGAFARLRVGGSFYQFTYGPACPVRRPILDRLGLKAVRIGRVMRNVPPAAVYRISRRKPKYI